MKPKANGVMHTILGKKIDYKNFNASKQITKKDFSKVKQIQNKRLNIQMNKCITI